MNRKKFIQISTAGSMAFLLNPLFHDAHDKKIKRYGIQLYSLRDVFGNDPGGILKQLAGFGYKEIESYEGPKGMWWGYGAKGFNQMVQDLGVSLICSHCNIASDFEKKLDEAAMIGMNYLLRPWIGKQKTIDDYKRIADDFNNKGKLAQAAGLKFGYHNHDYSFRLQDGIFPQDILMSNTDKDLVEYEMDIYWVAAAGQDPEQWLKKYPGRFRLCHIKDRSKNPGSDNGKNSTDLGKGSIDFKSVLRTAGKNEMKHYFVEQEFYPYGTSLEAAKSNASYLETLRF